MSLPGMVLSAVATAVGALMYWAVASQSTDLRFATTGVVLMIVGALGFVVSVIIFTDSKLHTRTSQFSRSRDLNRIQRTNDAVEK
jgi:hypothetical protein